MEDRRRYRGDYYNQRPYQSGQKSFTRSQYNRKPPQQQQRQLPPSDYSSDDVPAWVHSIPSWERKFITSVGRMPWGRFVYCQKSLNLYSDVLQWDDLAGGEAFHSAKSRFWAEMNGIPCDVPLPDPEMYIENIDWNSRTDSELYDDLDKVPIVPDEEKGVKAAVVDSAPSYVDQPIVPSGWDDDDTNWQGGGNKAANKDDPWVVKTEWEGLPWGTNSLKSLMKPIIPSGCDVAEDLSGTTHCPPCNPSLQDGNKKMDASSNPWESNCGGWEGMSQSHSLQDGRKTSDTNNAWEGNYRGWEDPTLQNSNWTSGKVDPWKSNCGGWESRAWGSSGLMKNPVSNFPIDHRNNDDMRRVNDNWRKRESEGRQLSRYKTTRYQGGDYQPDHGWKNNRGKKRVDFAHENFQADPPAPLQWNPAQTCGPNSHHTTGETGGSWGWQKQVSYHIN